MEMGNFYDVLAREEALRDPLVIHINPPDEDTPEGLQNRKTEVISASTSKVERTWVVCLLGAWRSRQTLVCA